MHDLVARNARAAVLFAAGNVKEVADMFEDTLRGCRALLGRDHHATPSVAGNLGAVRVSAGQRPESIRLIAENVVDRSRVLTEGRDRGEEAPAPSPWPTGSRATRTTPCSCRQGHRSAHAGAGTCAPGHAHLPDGNGALPGRRRRPRGSHRPTRRGHAGRRVAPPGTRTGPALAEFGEAIGTTFIEG